MTRIATDIQPTHPLNLTVADALGSLSSTIAAVEAEIAKGHLDEERRRSQKASICIEARSAFTCYKDYLRWHAAEPPASEADLLLSGRNSREGRQICEELGNAIRVLKVLGADERDDYLNSVQKKLTTLTS